MFDFYKLNQKPANALIKLPKPNLDLPQQMYA